MILKASKMGFEKKIIIPTDYVHCCVIGCHGNHCCISFEHLRGGGVKLFLNIYISMINENSIENFIFNVFTWLSLSL